MPKAVTYGKTERMSFARHEEIQSMPNLLEIQKNSYKWFLEEGLRDVFKDVDVITDYSGNLELRFVDYAMDENPEYTEEEFNEATFAFVKYYVQGTHDDTLVEENKKLKFELEQELEWRNRVDN